MKITGGENRRENKNIDDSKPKFMQNTGEKWKDVKTIVSEIVR